jgi:endonuclease/exonuclease/phosphatase family metal-dependent hydrolase
MKLQLKVLSWNICGARYLDFEEKGRIRNAINETLRTMIREHAPHIISLQEVAEYSANGNKSRKESMVEIPGDYTYLPSMILDTQRYPFQNKWQNARRKGGWPTGAYMAQGNAYLIRKDLAVFPATTLPVPGMNYEDYCRTLSPSVEPSGNLQPLVSEVPLQPGLYFGDRDTEPRLCSVLHIVLEEQNTQPGESFRPPLDVFVLNTHLTTLISECTRDTTNPEAENIRMRQLQTINRTIIQRFEKWYNSGFKIRGKRIEPGRSETHNRRPPAWILTGDLNITPGSKEYNYLMNEVGFNDLADKYCDKYCDKNCTGTKKQNRDSKPPLTLDYVLARPSYNCFREKNRYELTGRCSVLTIEGNPSDHFPLLATLDFCGSLS